MAEGYEPKPLDNAVDWLNVNTAKNFTPNEEFSFQKTSDGRMAVYVNGTWIGTLNFDSHP